jgi:hypothetical protein
MTQISKYKCNLCEREHPADESHGLCWPGGKFQIGLPEDYWRHICATCMYGICEVVDRLIERAERFEPLAAARAEIERLQAQLDIRYANSTNCYSIWASGQLRKCRGAKGFEPGLEDVQETTCPVMLSADDFRSMVKALEIVKAIENTRCDK